MSEKVPRSQQWWDERFLFLTFCRESEALYQCDDDTGDLDSQPTHPGDQVAVIYNNCSFNTIQVTITPQMISVSVINATVNFKLFLPRSFYSVVLVCKFFILLLPWKYNYKGKFSLCSQQKLFFPFNNCIWGTSDFSRFHYSMQMCFIKLKGCGVSHELHEVPT